MAPGATTTATVVHTATQADVDAGSLTNVATATVTFDGTDYSKTDTVTVTADQTPAWTFDKSAAPSTYDRGRRHDHLHLRHRKHRQRDAFGA